jgi:hypothetical protein
MRRTEANDGRLRAAVTTRLGQFFENFEPDQRVTIMRLWFTESAPRRRYLEITYEWEEILKGYFAFSGPFAWNGLPAFWSPVVTFFAWITVMSVLMFRAIESQDRAPSMAVALRG